MSTIFDAAYNDKVLNSAIRTLTFRQFLRESGAQLIDWDPKHNNQLQDTDLKRAAFLTSVLASSNKDEHRQKAMSFAILAYLDKPNIQFASFCYLILSRADNIQQGQHLTKVLKNEKFLLKYDEILNLEISSKRALALLQLTDTPPIYLSHFQRQLWQSLQTNTHITAISGPTSAGKSYMVQNHIIKSIREKETFKAIYIVPTRALISEVSSELRKRLANFEVSISVAVGDDEDIYNREIFVLTPERCLQILKDNPKRREFNFIFCDEIQKVEDAERGIIFEHVLNELAHTEQNANIVLAGPYLKNLQNTIAQLSGEKNGKVIESQLSPVYQLKAVFTLVDSLDYSIPITLKTSQTDQLQITIASDLPFYKLFGRSPIKAMAEFVNKYGKDTTNIIYAPTRAIAERYAEALAKIQKDTPTNKRISELIDFLCNEMHSSYSLIRCLRKGIAFHHGMIPDIAKFEIEAIYKDERDDKNSVIKNLVCTTTLLEGVNLPADRLFIQKPYKINSNYPLNNFDFGNLIGRAGRVRTNLYGSVFCIELEEEKWAGDKLDADPTKEIVPVTSKATSGYHKDELKANLTNFVTEMSAPEAIINTIIFLRQKAVKGREELEKYLASKNLSDSEIFDISEGIMQSIAGFDIKDNIIKLNPTIDPKLQDRLFKQISSDGWEKWLITKKPNPFAKRKRDLNAKFEEKTFYYQFEEIAERLDAIFKFVTKINSKKASGRNQKYWHSARGIAFYGSMWIEQKPMREIIESELAYIKSKERGDPKDIKVIDRTVLEVSRHINYEVKFELVKYFKLWADIMKSIMTEPQIKANEGKLALPLWLELGAHNGNVISLIRSGITRSVAIEIGSLLPENYEDDVIDWILKKENFNRLSAISRRHLKSLGFDPDSIETKQGVKTNTETDVTKDKQ